jgi:hypothetical protein
MELTHLEALRVCSAQLCPDHTWLIGHRSCSGCLKSRLNLLGNSRYVEFTILTYSLEAKHDEFEFLTKKLNASPTGLEPFVES